MHFFQSSTHFFVFIFSFQTGDSLFLRIECPELSSSSWSIRVIKFFNSFPRSPEMKKMVLVLRKIKLKTNTFLLCFLLGTVIRFVMQSQNNSTQSIMSTHPRNKHWLQEFLLTTSSSLPWQRCFTTANSPTFESTLNGAYSKTSLFKCFQKARIAKYDLDKLFLIHKTENWVF